METPDLEHFPLAKDEFVAQVRLALANVLDAYRGQANLLRPKINACLEDFGVRSREVQLRIPGDSQGFSVQFFHPVHGDILLEA